MDISQSDSALILRNLETPNKHYGECIPAYFGEQLCLPGRTTNVLSGMTPGLKRLPARFYRLDSGLEPVRGWLKELGPEDRSQLPPRGISDADGGRRTPSARKMYGSPPLLAYLTRMPTAVEQPVLYTVVSNL